MALDTYAALQQTVLDTLDRPDLSAQVPDWVLMCEARINRVLRDRVTRAALSLDAEYVQLPADCAELKSIRLNTSVYKRPLEVVTRETLAEQSHTRAGVTGIPSKVAFVGPRTLQVSPIPSQVFAAEIVYAARIAALASGGSLALLLENPDLYLYGTLVHSAPFLKEDDRLAMWQSLADQAFGELEVQLQRRELGPSLSPARLPRAF